MPLSHYTHSLFLFKCIDIFPYKVYLSRYFYILCEGNRRRTNRYQCDVQLSLKLLVRPAHFPHKLKMTTNQQLIQEQLKATTLSNC